MILLLAILAQQAPAENTHRVHLRNGNVIDGVLVRTDGKKMLVTFRLALGTADVRYSDVARMQEKCADKCCEGIAIGSYRIHSIRPRTKGERAILSDVEEPKEPRTDETKKDDAVGPRKDETKKDEPRKDEPKKDDRTGKVEPTKKSDAVEPTNPPTTSAEVRKRIDDQLKAIKAAVPEEKDRLAAELPKLGLAAAEYLADLVDRVDEEMASYVLTALNQQKEPKAIAILFDKMKSKNASIRVSVLQVLASMIDKESTPRIRAFLSDSDPSVRATSIGVLQRLEDEDSIEMIAKLVADPDSNVGKTAGAAIAIMAPRFEKVDETVEIVKDQLPRAKGKSLACVIEALGKLGRRDVVDDIIEYLDNPESEVRANVARACAALRAEEAVDALIDRLREETVQWVKTSICDAFDAIKAKKAIEPLIDLMEREESNDIDEAAARALQHLTGKEGFAHDHEKWREWWEKVKERNRDGDQ